MIAISTDRPCPFTIHPAARVTAAPARAVAYVERHAVAVAQPPFDRPFLAVQVKPDSEPGRVRWIRLPGKSTEALLPPDRE